MVHDFFQLKKIQKFTDYFETHMSAECMKNPMKAACK